MYNMDIDNQSAISLAKNAVLHSCTKHIERVDAEEIEFI